MEGNSIAVICISEGLSSGKGVVIKSGDDAKVVVDIVRQAEDKARKENSPSLESVLQALKDSGHEIVELGAIYLRK